MLRCLHPRFNDHWVVGRVARESNEVFFRYDAARFFERVCERAVSSWTVPEELGDDEEPGDVLAGEVRSVGRDRENRQVMWPHRERELHQVGPA